jgi:uncharacterized protein YjbJ (UPF0337 family)
VRSAGRVAGKHEPQLPALPHRLPTAWRIYYQIAASHADEHAGVEPKIIHQEIGMSINKDQVKGRIDEAKGKAKEVVGKVLGNKELEQKGKIETGVGKVEAGYGDLKHDIKKGL